MSLQPAVRTRGRVTLAWILGSLLAAPGLAAGDGALADLQNWMERCRKGTLRPAESPTVDERLHEAQVLAMRRPELQRDYLRAVVALAGLECDTPQLAAELEAAHELGRGELQQCLRGGWPGGPSASTTLAFLTREVLPSPSFLAGERAAAIALVASRSESDAGLSLLMAARTSSGEVREAALKALVGRKEKAVHQYFISELERPTTEIDLAGLEAARAHVRRQAAHLGAASLERLAAVCARKLVAADWRDATLGAELAGVLGANAAPPLLIEALLVWQKRAEQEQGSLRVECEITRALEKLSGRTLGRKPELWRSWWLVKRRGASPGEDWSGTRPPEGSRTTAAFFGLKPESDRVIFVIDRSGSMAEPLDTARMTRYEAAMEQVQRFLEAAGEHTRFGIVLFNDKAWSWRPDLARATREGREAARTWLQNNAPSGGTNLRAGVEALYPLDDNAEVDLASLQADTVVVLCDGQTGGPDWVEAWLARYNAKARLRFECVQLGQQGDGALQALASQTGGTFIQILRP